MYGRSHSLLEVVGLSAVSFLLYKTKKDAAAIPNAASRLQCLEKVKQLLFVVFCSLIFNRKEFPKALPRGFPLKMSTPNLFRGLNIKFRILIPKGQNETSKIPLWFCFGDSSLKKFFIAFTKTYAEKTKRAVFCQRSERNKKRRN